MLRTAARTAAGSVRTNQSGLTSANRTTASLPITIVAGMGSSKVPVPVTSPIGFPLAIEARREGSSNIYRVPKRRPNALPASLAIRKLAVAFLDLIQSIRHLWLITTR
jgi:hypothetical protein